MHTLKIAVIDLSGRTEALSPTGFIQLLGARLDRLPALRRRVVPIPHRLGHPVWVEDPDFDLSRHVRWRVATRPRRRPRAGRAGRPRSRPARCPATQPLWELTVVDGLEGGLTAFVVKLHHAMADGGAAVAMLENAFVLDDADAYSAARRPRATADPPPALPPGGASRSRRIARLPRFASQTTAGLSRGRAGPTATARCTLPRPLLVAPHLPERVARPRPDLRHDGAAAERSAAASSARARCTFNDVFLAVCGGGLRRYLDQPR